MSQTITATEKSTDKKQSLTSRILSYVSLSSNKIRMRAFFGVMFNVDLSTAYGISHSNRSKTVQVKNIIESILAWMSFQAGCFNEKGKDLQEKAGFIYGSLWKNNREKPIGMLYDHSQNHLRFCYYEKEVTEEEVLEKPFLGQTIIVVMFDDRQSAIELIKCIYEECGCEIGHKEVCPIFGFKLLLKELGIKEI